MRGENAKKTNFEEQRRGKGTWTKKKFGRRTGEMTQKGKNRAVVLSATLEKIKKKGELGTGGGPPGGRGGCPIQNKKPASELGGKGGSLKRSHRVKGKERGEGGPQGGFPPLWEGVGEAVEKGFPGRKGGDRRKRKNVFGGKNKQVLPVRRSAEKRKKRKRKRGGDEDYWPVKGKRKNIFKWSMGGEKGKRGAKKKLQRSVVGEENLWGGGKSHQGKGGGGV